MAKKQSSSQRKEQLNNLFGIYNKRLEALYNDYITQLALLGYGNSIHDADILFNLKNFPEFKARLDDIFDDYFQKNILCQKNGITDGVALALRHDNAVLRGFSVLSDNSIRLIRETATLTFIRSRLNAKDGLNLSQRVWNYCQQSKSEFETAMSNVIADGIKKGTSAEEIGRRLRQYLNNPDMMYRRYHTMVVLKNGKKKDVVTWRRRKIIDGKVRFVEEPLAHVGQGVYRSARKNALRVARTEINASYLRGHNARWANEPFVIGQYIHVSPQHVIDDICNELEGRYPKDFVFASWHPQCLCTSDPIMLQGDERKEFYRRLMRGEDMSNYVSPNTITDVPDRYKQYIEEHEDAIMNAYRKDKLAWHLADNKKYWQRFMSAENQAEMGVNTLSPKEKVLQAAKERHAKRTQTQIDNIQKRWNKHRLDYYDDLATKMLGGKNIANINSAALTNRYDAVKDAIYNKKDANYVQRAFERFSKGYHTKELWTDRKIAINVLNTAKNYGETNILGVQKALKAADYTVARQEAMLLAKQIKAIQNEEAKLSKLIPDVNKWHKQFTLQELNGVYNAVESKLAQWNYLTLEQQQKKLTFEAYSYLGGNMNGVQAKYATWQVSQAAYIKKLAEVTDVIDWASINSKFADIKSYKTQSKIYHKLVYDINNAIANQDKILANNLLAQAQQKKDALIDAKAKREAKKGLSSAETFSQARKDAAVWDKGAGGIADKTLIDVASQQWIAASNAEKDYTYEYTRHYCDVNEPLQGRHYMNYQSKQRFVDKVNNITNYIEKNELPVDMWFTRGDSDMNTIKSRIEFAGGTMPSRLQDLVGKEMLEGGFMSTASRKDGGFHSDIRLNIFAPKGTKAAYIEPFSYYGNGADRAWDGIQRFKTYSQEHETLFQRGTRMRITKVYQEGRKTYIDCEVIGQDVRNLSYVDDKNISM